VQCFASNAQPAIDCATPESISAPLYSLQRLSASSPDRSCNTARLAEAPTNPQGPRRSTPRLQKPKPCGPKLELPTSFTRVRRIGARFDGTLQICVSHGTSMRFRTSEYDLCPLQERILDNPREGVRNKLCVEPYRARPVAENHHSWLR